MCIVSTKANKPYWQQGTKTDRNQLKAADVRDHHVVFLLDIQSRRQRWSLLAALQVPCRLSYGTPGRKTKGRGLFLRLDFTCPLRHGLGSSPTTVEVVFSRIGVVQPSFLVRWRRALFLYKKKSLCVWTRVEIRGTFLSTGTFRTKRCTFGPCRMLQTSFCYGGVCVC